VPTNSTPNSHQGMVVGFICGFCFGALFVVMCWMFERCSWFLGGMMAWCPVFERFLFLCLVLCSGGDFVEYGAIVVFVLRIWLGQLAVR